MIWRAVVVGLCRKIHTLYFVSKSFSDYDDEGFEERDNNINNNDGDKEIIFLNREIFLQKKAKKFGGCVDMFDLLFFKKIKIPLFQTLNFPSIHSKQVILHHLELQLHHQLSQ